MGELKDRSGLLVLAGIVELLIGALLLLFVPLSFLGGSTDSRSLAVSACVYLALAAFFGWTGAATLRRRRWARTLMHSVAGLWLVVGIAAFVFWLAMSPIVHGMMATSQPQDFPSGLGTVVKIVISLMLLIVYVAIPAALFLILRSRSVRATVERHDPTVPWTDRVSAPVLSMILTLVYLGATGLLLAPFGGAPFFGSLLGPWPSAAIWVAVAGLSAWLARLYYRADPRACWGTIALTLAGTASAVLTFLRVDSREMWGAFGLPDEQLELLGDSWLLGSSGMIWMTLLSGASVIVYALHVRRHIRAESKVGD